MLLTRVTPADSDGRHFTAKVLQGLTRVTSDARDDDVCKLNVDLLRTDHCNASCRIAMMLKLTGQHLLNMCAL